MSRDAISIGNILLISSFASSEWPIVSADFFSIVHFLICIGGALTLPLCGDFFHQSDGSTAVSAAPVFLCCVDLWLDRDLGLRSRRREKLIAVD
ncbi:MAG: hypothetical protein WBP38_00900 [Hyphomicrobium sp.]|nr:hypothetical protein [Hyphomicrobium sp.]